MGIVTCGHPHRPYKARGLCTACYIAQRRLNHPTLMRAQKRAWVRNNPDRVKASALKASFGPAAPALYQQRLKEQGGVCAICGKPPKKKQLSFDHDHKTNRLRGLLCSSCNLRLGHLEDRKWHDAAAAYLRRFLS